MIEDPRLAATLPYVAWNNAVTPQEADQIVAIGDGLALEDAAIGTATTMNNRIRVTRTAAFPREPRTEAVYARIEMLARALNEKVYQFDLTGFSEPFQYSVYQDSEGGHYDWHVDHGLAQVHRKLSFSLQLSDPAQYEGCDLELFTSNEVAAAPRARGTLIAFPAYALHRITPIVSGTRKALVIWTAGPKFR